MLWISLGVLEINAVDDGLTDRLGLSWMDVNLVLLNVPFEFTTICNGLLTLWNGLSRIAHALSLYTGIILSFTLWFP